MCLFWTGPYLFRLAICWVLGPDVYSKFCIWSCIWPHSSSLLHPHNQRQDCHFPGGPGYVGRTQQCWRESLSWRCLVFVRSLFCGFFPPLLSRTDASGWYWCRRVAGLRGGGLFFWCHSLSFRLTSRFGIVLEAPPEPSSTCFSNLATGLKADPAGPPANSAHLLCS